MNWNFFSSALQDNGDKKTITHAFKELDCSKYRYTIADDYVDISRRIDYYWSCSIKTLNGMCGVMLIYGVALATMKEEDMNFLMDLAKWGGYTYIMATNVTGGHAEKQLLSFGFEATIDFTNKRTRNPVAIFMKKV